MSKLFTTLINSTAISLLLMTILTHGGRASETTGIPHIDLALSFDIDNTLVRGTMKATIPAAMPLSFNLDGLEITGALMNSVDRENQIIDLKQSSFLGIDAEPFDRVLILSYEKTVDNNFRDLISTEAIVLTSLWHPVPDTRSTFSLRAIVPPGFTAISESDVFSETAADGSAFFSFSQPVYGLTFSAAPYIHTSRSVREGLFVHTLFFPEEQHLAEGYLDSAVAYISRYESLLGTFPYNHYAIVANPNPTGFGLPTFTLLGRQVLRLPFIRETSLGHEILHSYFGNSISVSNDSANWTEGLTTYLADMAYREDAGEGALSRKEKITEYQSYVLPDTPPLNEFFYAGHNNGNNRAQRAVGYGRAAMVFHELREQIGDDLFFDTLAHFYELKRGEAASWDDIRVLFEQKTGQDLKQFFSQRLMRIELPEIAIANVRFNQLSDSSSLSFTVEQKTPELFDFTLPFTVLTVSGKETFSEKITERITTIEAPVTSIPVELLVDPDYDIMRVLSDSEYTPVLSAFMGNKETTLILADESERSLYQPIIDLASRFSWRVVEGDTGDAITTGDGFLIFLGHTSPLLQSMYGSPAHPELGFTLDIRAHPSIPKTPIAIIHSNSVQQTKSVASRLSHYGKYSFLHFENGRIKEKRIKNAAFGIRIPLLPKPNGFQLTGMRDFEDLINSLSQHRVIYVGETHTSRADHLLQYMILVALHQKNPNIAIGMEMFPRSSQQALDDYIHGTNDSEAVFLRDSGYFDVWGYDYRLFRPIFMYAKNHGIDVVGLNIEREVVSAVFKANGPDELTPEQQQKLPSDRVLDMEGYADRLRQTYSVHGDSEKAAGSFNGFIHAQALWDETMAESIYRYITDNPSKQMVVLAGSQHTRKDSGIPPRVYRRSAIPQASVLNLFTSSYSGKLLAATTDYLFFLDAPDFSPQGKIGIVLQEIADLPIPGLKIIDINPSSHAEKAGIKKNDILTHIHNQQIANMDDVRTAMLDKSVGEVITIVLKRANEDGDFSELTVEVPLFNPNQMKHP